MTNEPSRTNTPQGEASRAPQTSRQPQGTAPRAPQASSPRAPQNPASRQRQSSTSEAAKNDQRTSSQARSKTQTARERVKAESQENIVIFGKPMSKAEIFKLWGLLAFFILVVVIVVLVWPYLGRMFDPAGREQLISDVRGAGPVGVLMLLGLQFLQVIVALIPGEVVQMAAGAIYGPWMGALIILVGCFFSSWFIYEVVHRLGQPFVEAMVPTKYLDRFRAFEAKGKLTPLVAVLFLIPGMPKDVFTYLVPLTHMPRNTFLTIATLARIPGVLMSTYAASGLVDGNLKTSIAIFVALAIIAGVAYFFKDKLLDRFGRR